jgi:hypothetical protein
MDKEVSIVKVDRRHYRVIARENWGLTREQMKGKHVHHRIKRSDGGTNDPSNLYVCSEWFHDKVWHAGEGGFAGCASAAGRKGGKVGGGWNRGIPHSEEWREKLTTSLRRNASLGGNSHRKGKRITEDQKTRIREANKGKPKPQSQRDKMSSANKGRKHWVNKEGERRFQEKAPGADWQNGRVWRPGKIL